MTFTNLLMRNYWFSWNFRFTGDISNDIARYHRLPKNRRRRIRLFTGHAPFFTGLPDADLLPIITLLRDPVKRVMSYCQHVSEGKSPYLRDQFHPDHFDLDRFLESNNYELENLQTKMLLGRQDSHKHMPTTRSFADMPELALEVLFRQVECFGIQEFFDESVLLFAKHFTWRTPYYLRINEAKASRRLTWSQGQIEKVRTMNGLDIEVYRKAREEFLKRIRLQGIPQQLAHFRSQQQAMTIRILLEGWLGRVSGLLFSL